MSFNIGLTGIRAADSELRTSGNNIANASTIGFKRSRAEFGDVYASSILGSAGNASGSGVQLNDVAQQFNQGNISFTDNSLDLAVNGSGFFIMSNQGDPSYSRAGLFSTDSQGFIVDNAGANLQGFGADEDGNIINGVLTDLQIDTGDQPPRPTDLVDTELNLDSTQLAPESLVNTANGASTLAPQAVSPFQSSITTSVESTFDFTGAVGANSGPGTIDITINGTTIPITLTGTDGGGDAAAEIATQINAGIAAASPIAGLDAASSITAVGSVGVLEIIFEGTEAAENNNFVISYPTPSANNTVELNRIFQDLNNPITAEYVLPQNGYVPGELEVVTGIGTRTLDLSQIVESGNPTARQIAAEINIQNQTENYGVSASASTQFRLYLGNDSDSPSATADFTGAAADQGGLFLGLKSTANGNVSTFIDLTVGDPNGISPTLTAISAEDIADSINSAGISGLSATVTQVAGVNVVDITAANGEDVIIQNNTTSSGELIIEGLVGGGGGVTGAEQLISANEQSVIGGEVSLILDDGVAIEQGGGAGNIWGTLSVNTGNSFDPTNPETYNSATSVTIYDSQGNAHVMTQYFVKNRTDPLSPGATGNSWSMIVQIDGQDVGNPLPNTTEPSLAQFPIEFNSDGSLSASTSGPFLITNWTPLDSSGNANGSAGPDLSGILPLDDDDTSSNFVIDINGSTQFGSPFSVNDIEQDGFATGRLTGLTIDDEGIMFARFTNGQAQVLGQVVLAGFTNEQGLQPIGSTGWAETFESGSPLVGAPQTAALGAIQSGALEDSNVDISSELVSLIIAQRNYQANARTISTADETTQTILNI